MNIDKQTKISNKNFKSLILEKINFVVIVLLAVYVIPLILFVINKNFGEVFFRCFGSITLFIISTWILSKKMNREKTKMTAILLIFTSIATFVMGAFYERTIVGVFFILLGINTCLIIVSMFIISNGGTSKLSYMPIYVGYCTIALVIVPTIMLLIENGRYSVFSNVLAVFVSIYNILFILVILIASKNKLETSLQLKKKIQCNVCNKYIENDCIFCTNCGKKV